MKKLLVLPPATLLSLAIGLSFPALAHAEDEIATDRPDFVESAQTVGKGRFQIETSIAYERNSDSGVRTRARATPTLLRYGFSDDWEVRLERDGLMRVHVEDHATGDVVTERGWSDLSLGLKWHTQDGDEKTGKPSVAWLFHADLPSGSDEFKGHGVRPSLRTVLEWELPNDMSFGLMPGFAWDSTEDGKRFFSGILAGVIGKSLTEDFRVFAEISGQHLARKKYGGNIVTVDLGAAYLLTKNMQVDTAFSWGLTNETPDFAATVGFSVRF